MIFKSLNELVAIKGAFLILDVRTKIALRGAIKTLSSIKGFDKEGLSFPLMSVVCWGGI